VEQRVLLVLTKRSPLHICGVGHEIEVRSGLLVRVVAGTGGAHKGVECVEPAAIRIAGEVLITGGHDRGDVQGRCVGPRSNPERSKRGKPPVVPVELLALNVDELPVAGVDAKGRNGRPPEPAEVQNGTGPCHHGLPVNVAPSEPM
jgi:hypothetical protein